MDELHPLSVSSYVRPPRCPPAPGTRWPCPDPRDPPASVIVLDLNAMPWPGPFCTRISFCSWAQLLLINSHVMQKKRGPRPRHPRGLSQVPSAHTTSLVSSYLSPPNQPQLQSNGGPLVGVDLLRVRTALGACRDNLTSKRKTRKMFKSQIDMLRTPSSFS